MEPPSRSERQYGKARRLWLMGRGAPTEEVLAEMRVADPPVNLSGGHAKGSFDLEKYLVAEEWAIRQRQPKWL